MRELNVLDFNWVTRETSPVQSLKATLAIARRAEALGYGRMWIGEHHIRSNACGSPQILAAVLASTTKRIRIGIGACRDDDRYRSSTRSDVGRLQHIRRSPLSISR